MVRTAVYAAPGRERNNQWCAFMQTPDVNFCPVPRCGGEANDAALIAKIRELASGPQKKQIALMVQDNGFLPMIQDISPRADLVVLVPSRKFNVLRRFEKAGVRVRSLDPIRDTSPRIRALLHADGTGSVQFADPYISYDSSAQAELVRGFVGDLAYDAGGYLIHATSKFWFQNGLGPITVFPHQCATQAVHEVMESRGHGRWKRCQSSLAFVIPKTSPGSSTSMQVHRYGSVLARRIFRGGGPFMLPDAPVLTSHVLRRLGYLDDDLNSDLAEAMIVFINMSDNKHCLRKLGMLPSSNDTPPEVEDRLRAAFLSHQSAGLWQGAPMDGRVRQVLEQRGLLESASKASKAQVLKAMRSFASSAKLPPARTYNGHVWQIQSHLTSDNSLRTAAITFEL